MIANDSACSVYGTTYEGGSVHIGVVFRVSPSGQETVLHDFADTADGETPQAGVIGLLVRDGAGNFYGTISYGSTESCFYSNGTSASAVCGLVFELSATGTYTVLHSFAGARTHGTSPIGLCSTRPAIFMEHQSTVA